MGFHSDFYISVFYHLILTDQVSKVRQTSARADYIITSAVAICNTRVNSESFCLVTSFTLQAKASLLRCYRAGYAQLPTRLIVECSLRYFHLFVCVCILLESYIRYSYQIATKNTLYTKSITSLVHLNLCVCFRACIFKIDALTYRGQIPQLSNRDMSGMV